MPVEDALVAKLKSCWEVKQRAIGVFVQNIPSDKLDDERPVVLYREAGSVRKHTMAGYAGLRGLLYAVDIIARDSSDVRAISESIDTLDDFIGYVNGYNIALMRVRDGDLDKYVPPKLAQERGWRGMMKHVTLWVYD